MALTSSVGKEKCDGGSGEVYGRGGDEVVVRRKKDVNRREKTYYGEEKPT